MPSIVRRGLLSHDLVLERGVPYHAIYDSEIVSNRQDRLAPDGKNLWQFANVYFQARNPMMYRVVHEKDIGDLAVIGLNRSVLDIPGAFITDGNAANSATRFFTVKDGLDALAETWDIVTDEWWNAMDGSKRKIMAECLVPGAISVANQKTADEVRASIGSSSVIPTCQESSRVCDGWRRTPARKESSHWRCQHSVVDSASLCGKTSALRCASTWQPSTFPL